MHRVLSLIVVALLLWAVPAAAFTPDEEELAGLVVKSYGPLTSWQAKMTFPDHPGITVGLWYNQGQWRQEWTFGDTAVAVGKDDQVVASCVAGGFAANPMFLWMPVNPLESWHEWGVDLSVRNFGFFGDAPCLMLGAEPGNQTAPTVFLNNETKGVVFLRYRSGADTVSIEYGDFRTFGGYPLPQKVVITVGEQTLECAVKWVRVKQAEDPGLYAREGLDLTPCVQSSAPFIFLRDTFSYPEAR